MSRFSERERLHVAVISSLAFLAIDRPIPALITAGFFLGLETARAFDYYDRVNNLRDQGRGRLLRVVMGKPSRQ